MENQANMFINIWGQGAGGREQGAGSRGYGVGSREHGGRGGFDQRVG